MIANPPSSSSSRRLIEILCNTDLYKDYAAAFQQMTALSLTLELPGKNEHLIQATTAVTPTGITFTHIPVRLGKTLIAVLRISGVRLQPETMPANSSCPEFIDKPVIDTPRYEASIALLKSFAWHLGESAHRLLFATTVNEPQPIRNAKAFILQHLSEPMSLEAVAGSVNISPFHFCKVFKRATSMTFTDYVNHVRVEKARRMLMRPSARIIDVAYDVGFQSLSHFNRSFRRIVNESPTEYRARMKSSRPTAFIAA
jgi:AraC-like DNA-binding protein